MEKAHPPVECLPVNLPLIFGLEGCVESRYCLSRCSRVGSAHLLYSTLILLYTTVLSYALLVVTPNYLYLCTWLNLQRCIQFFCGSYTIAHVFLSEAREMAEMLLSVVKEPYGVERAT